MIVYGNMCVLFKDMPPSQGNNINTKEIFITLQQFWFWMLVDIL